MEVTHPIIHIYLQKFIDLCLSTKLDAVSILKGSKSWFIPHKVGLHFFFLYHELIYLNVNHWKLKCSRKILQKTRFVSLDYKFLTVLLSLSACFTFYWKCGPVDVFLIILYVPVRLPAWPWRDPHHQHLWARCQDWPHQVCQAGGLLQGLLLQGQSYDKLTQS